MDSKKRENVCVQPPLENFSKTKISKAKESAGGIPAVWSSMKHSWQNMGSVRTAKTLLKVNQKKGFDCPGCAWPDPEDKRSIVEFCENGAKAVAEEATKKRINIEFFQKYSIKQLSEQSDYWLGKQGRLTHPMYLAKDSNHYEEITWEDAFAKIGKQLNALSSPDEAAIYTSGRTSNEAAFLLQLFARMFGTNNLPDCSNMCHESSGVGLKEVIGIGKGTVTLADFEHADCIVVLGQNPGTNHPRMLTALQKAARNGCEIITINPLPEAGTNKFSHPQEISAFLGQSTQLTTLFLQVKINGDVALLKGIMKELVAIAEKTGVIDYEFIKEKTLGFKDFILDINKMSWDVIEKETGLSKDKICEAATTIAKSKRVICCWAMGLTQHQNGVANIQEVVNLLLLGGHFGRKGAGACPVRGHSNVQGDRTMGIMSKPSEAFLKKLEELFDFTPPRKVGLDTVASIKAMHEEKVKVFFAMGGNFLSATPDTEYTAKALQKCKLTIQVSTKLNRSHLVVGKEALILPCLGRTEQDKQNDRLQFSSVENSMGIVHKTQGLLPPASKHLKSEIDIINSLAVATLKNTSVPWESLTKDYNKIRDYIAKAIPDCENYNKRLSKNSFCLANSIRDNCKFSTSSGKAHFTVHDIPQNSIASEQYLMMTIRSHDQYNTTIYGLDDRYRGIKNGRRVILMNKDDMNDASLKKGDLVDITSYFKDERRKIKQFMVIPYSIPKQCVATYFPEANPLVPLNNKAKKSNTPASKSIIVSLKISNL